MTIKTKTDFINALVQAGIFPEDGEMLVQNRGGSIFACKHQPERTETGWKTVYIGNELRPMGWVPMFLGWHCTTVTLGEMTAFLGKVGGEKVKTEKPAAYHQPCANFDLFLAKGFINKAKNADDRKLDFNLDLDDWKAIYSTTHCPVTGREMLVGTRKDGVPCPDDLLTVERLNPRLGYVKGNVVAMSYVANNAKSTIDTFLHSPQLTDAAKLKVLRKAIYQLEKEMKLK